MKVKLPPPLDHAANSHSLCQVNFPDLRKNYTYTTWPNCSCIRSFKSLINAVKRTEYIKTTEEHSLQLNGYSVSIKFHSMDSDRTFKQEQNRSRGLHYLLICVEIDTVYAAF